jgi:hypothetical protein
MFGMREAQSSKSTLQIRIQVPNLILAMHRQLWQAATAKSNSTPLTTTNK